MARASSLRLTKWWGADGAMRLNRIGHAQHRTFLEAATDDLKAHRKSAAGQARRDARRRAAEHREQKRRRDPIDVSGQRLAGDLSRIILLEWKRLDRGGWGKQRIVDRMHLTELPEKIGADPV